MTNKTFNKSLIPTASGDFIYGNWVITSYIQDSGCDCCSSSVMYDAYTKDCKEHRYDFTSMYKLLEELDEFDQQQQND